MKANDPFRSHSVTAFYHFTDRRNLASIQSYGGLYSLAKLQKKEIEVPAPGGNQWSRDADAIKKMDRYVHLCFRPTHPMEYTAHQDGRIGESIFLEIHPDVLAIGGVMFSPDVANKSDVPTHPIAKAYELIDFEVLYTRIDWNDPAIQARLQKAEKCEILVPDHIPLKLIRNFPDG